MRVALLAAVALATAAALVLAAGADRSIFLALNHALAVVPAPLLAGLSLAGLGLYAVLLFTPALALAPRMFAAVVLAAPVAGALTHLAKHAFKVPRPLAVLSDAQVHVIGQALQGSNSLPSGHSVTAAACATLFILGLQPRQRHPLLVAMAIALGGMLALSRIAVGAHWPSDVLSGGAVGVVAGCAGVHLADRWRFWAQPAGQWALAAIALACAIAGIVSGSDVPEANLLRAALIVLGLASVAGWLIDRPNALKRA